MKAVMLRTALAALMRFSFSLGRKAPKRQMAAAIPTKNMPVSRVGTGSTSQNTRIFFRWEKRIFLARSWRKNEAARAVRVAMARTSVLSVVGSSRQRAIVPKARVRVAPVVLVSKVRCFVCIFPL